MASLTDLKRRSRLEASLYVTRAVAEERARAIGALVDAGVGRERAEEIVDAALEREELSSYEPDGDQRIERARAALDTLVFLYTAEHPRLEEGVRPAGQAEPVEISLRQIVVDPEVQIRTQVSQDRIGDFADRMREGDQFPPLTCVWDRERGELLLADGFHRYEAARRSSLRVTFPCVVYAGTRKDAEVYAVAANARHGQPLSNEEKKRAVYRLLRLYPEWSDRRIARVVGCSHPFVAKRRKEMPASGNGYQMPEQRIVQRGDQTYLYTPPARTSPPDEAGGEGVEGWAQVWELERRINEHLDVTVGGNPEARLAWLEEVRGNRFAVPDDLDLPRHRGRDFKQAINNVIEQIRQQQRRVAEQRGYTVQSTGAREIAAAWLKESLPDNLAHEPGQPEINDRWDAWTVPVTRPDDGEVVGWVGVDARTGAVVERLTTRKEVLVAGLSGLTEVPKPPSASPIAEATISVPLPNIVALGDCEDILRYLPDESVDLVFTSPPYYNARPECGGFVSYDEYLGKIRRVIREVHRVLGEGRFFVVNLSPVLVPRPHRQATSKRLAVPFDVHTLFVEEGYDFVDDIIWMKPEGAGWATGRGRRFAADRNPLQYKPVPVTEYVLVYRKHTDRPIDWNIRQYPQEVRDASRIGDGYERTNVWRINPVRDPRHPAVFPPQLAERVIRYYSFVGDVVLDPFAGIGTTGTVAADLERRFVLVEREPRYFDAIRQELADRLDDVLVLDGRE